MTYDPSLDPWHKDPCAGCGLSRQNHYDEHGPVYAFRQTRDGRGRFGETEAYTTCDGFVEQTKKEAV